MPTTFRDLAPAAAQGDRDALHGLAGLTGAVCAGGDLAALARHELDLHRLAEATTEAEVRQTVDELATTTAEASRTLRARQAVDAAEQAAGGVRARVLAAVRSGVGRPSRIADELGLTRPQVSRALAELVEAGELAQTDEGVTDGRARTYAPAAKGPAVTASGGVGVGTRPEPIRSALVSMLRDISGAQSGRWTVEPDVDRTSSSPYDEPLPLVATYAPILDDVEAFSMTLIQRGTMIESTLISSSGAQLVCTFPSISDAVAAFSEAGASELLQATKTWKLT